MVRLRFKRGFCRNYQRIHHAQHMSGETDLPFEKYGGTIITTGNKIGYGKVGKGKREKAGGGVTLLNHHHRHRRRHCCFTLAEKNYVVIVVDLCHRYLPLFQHTTPQKQYQLNNLFSKLITCQGILISLFVENYILVIDIDSIDAKLLQ